MAVKIRLKRMGAKKKPFYRIIVADSRSPRDGKFIEELGYYDPLKDPAEIKVNAEKAQKWLATGAQPTDTVRALLKKAGVEMVKKAPKARPAAPAEEPAAEAQAPAEEAASEAQAPVEEAAEAVSEEEAPAADAE